MLVVDANIAVKWFSKERGSDLALFVMKRQTLLYAPEIIHWEVLGGILKAARRGEVAADDARESCSNWLQFLDDRNILLWESKSLQKTAIELSLSLGHGFQDCLYLALAMELEAELITADEPFWKRAIPTYLRISYLFEPPAS